VAVSIAEYLGQRTDIDGINITPVALGSLVPCPFKDGFCSKLSKKKKPNHPVCSVRKLNGTMWIVCEHRLCATSRTKKDENDKSVKAGLVEHQRDILWEISKTVYRGEFDRAQIVINREVEIPIEEVDGKYRADYIMRNIAPGSKVDEILLEMQGGGETNKTGSITEHVDNWSANANPTNVFLREYVNAGTIETNAWRRQQEQFLVKGNIVNQTGGKIVFAIGGLIYDYLYPRVSRANLRDLREHNWTLCLLGISEDKSSSPVPGPIPLAIDEDRLLFTNYATFVRTLTDQGGPEPSIFKGDFISLTGDDVKL